VLKLALYLVPMILVLAYFLFGYIVYPILISRHAVKTKTTAGLIKIMFLIGIWGCVLLTIIPIRIVPIHMVIPRILCLVLLAIYSFCFLRNKLLKIVAVLYLVSIFFVPRFAIELKNAIKEQISTIENQQAETAQGIEATS